MDTCLCTSHICTHTCAHLHVCCKISHIQCCRAEYTKALTEWISSEIFPYVYVNIWFRMWARASYTYVNMWLPCPRWTVQLVLCIYVYVSSPILDVTYMQHRHQNTHTHTHTHTEIVTWRSPCLCWIVPLMVRYKFLKWEGNGNPPFSLRRIQSARWETPDARVRVKCVCMYVCMYACMFVC